MGAYNRSTYIRAAAAKEARTLSDDMRAYRNVDHKGWTCLALAQAYAMSEPSLAQNYLDAARGYIHTARHNIAQTEARRKLL